MKKEILIRSRNQGRSVSILSVVEGLILIGVLVLIMSEHAWGEEKKGASSKYNLGEIIVTATKTETYQAEVGSSTTVISAEDIKKTGKRSVQEVLRNVPGVAVIETGSFGGETSLYLRGSNRGHTLVLIDGIEVNDPIKSDSSFDFAHLTTDNIERIEVVRGPQSTLYGSDAMAGVINIITKKGKGKGKWEISSEGGSHNTFRENANLSGDTKIVYYSMSSSRLDSEGVSKAIGGSERDGYKNIVFSSKLGYKIFDNSELSVVARFTDAQTELDDGAYDDDPNNIAWWRNIAGKIAFEEAVNPIWDHKLSFSYSETRRKYKDDTDSVDPTDNTHNWFKGDMKKFEWQHNVCPVDWDTLTCGFEYEEERGFADGKKTSNRLDTKIIDTAGYYLQGQFKLWEKLFITPGLRIDNHELFGTETTYKISTAYVIAKIGTRLKANWGTAFKAPSLYQLYHPTYGDSNLNPDESKGYDFGFEQGFFNDKVSFDSTYFHNNFKNMVDWDSDTSRYKNKGKAETKGFEAGAKFLPIQNLTIGTNFSYVDTKDEETGKKLTKRPENQIGLDINWLFLEKTNFNLNAKYVGHNWNNSANTQKVKSYTKVDFSTFYGLTKHFEIFGRVENLFDRTYAQIRGYAAPSRSFYVGGKVTF